MGKYDQALDLALTLVATETDTDITPEQVRAWSPDDLFEWLLLGYDMEWNGHHWRPAP